MKVSGPLLPRCLRERVSEFFEMDCESPYMLLVAPVRRSLRIPMTSEQEKLFGIDKLNVPRSDHSRHHPRRLLGSRADRSARGQPAIL